MPFYSGTWGHTWRLPKTPIAVGKQSRESKVWSQLWFFFPQHHPVPRGYFKPQFVLLSVLWTWDALIFVCHTRLRTQLQCVVTRLNSDSDFTLHLISCLRQTFSYLHCYRARACVCVLWKSFHPWTVRPLLSGRNIVVNTQSSIIPLEFRLLRKLAPQISHIWNALNMKNSLQ